MTVKSSARVVYLIAILSQKGANLNMLMFKSSNARGIARGGGRGGGGVVMLMFRIHQRITKSGLCQNLLKK